MQMIEKAGRRVAMMERLIHPKTGQPIEVECHTEEQENSMRMAGLLGENMAKMLLKNFADGNHQTNTRGELRTI